MPTFDIETEEVRPFETRDTYIFKTYFDEKQLFKQLETYYNEHICRFEILHGDLREVRQLLNEYYYELSVTANPKEYTVVVSKETDSRDILSNTAMRKHREQHEILVMKDELSKEQGAVCLEKSDVNKEELE